MEGYTVKIEESSEELKGKQRIIMKDTSDALKLDEATEGGNSIVIKVEKWAILKVHNEKSDDKEYENYIIVDSEGHKFVTGSQSFWSSFINIYEDVNGYYAYNIITKKRTESQPVMEDLDIKRLEVSSDEDE